MKFLQSPFPSIPKDQLCSILIRAIVVEEFGMALYWLSSRMFMTASFTKPATSNSSATLEIQGVRDVSHISHFPEGRKTLFSVGGSRDFHDGTGHEVTVSFQQSAGCSVWFAGLPLIKDIQCSFHGLFTHP